MPIWQLLCVLGLLLFPVFDPPARLFSPSTKLARHSTQTSTNKASGDTQSAQTPAPTTRRFCSPEFGRSSHRVDEKAKACLDEAWPFLNEVGSTVVLVGESGSGKNVNTMLAVERAYEVMRYLVLEKGADRSSITLRTGTKRSNQVEIYLVPAGSLFSGVPETELVDESTLDRMQSRTASARRRYEAEPTATAPDTTTAPQTTIPAPLSPVETAGEPRVRHRLPKFEIENKTSRAKRFQSATAKNQPPKEPGDTDPVALALSRLKPGNLAYSTPETMKTDETAHVVARIGSGNISIATLKAGMPGVQPQAVAVTPVSTKMKMTLKSADFDITPLSSEEQIVAGSIPTTWEWEIVPRHAGKLQLHLAAVVEINDLSRDFTTVDRDIAVKVDPLDATTKFVQGNWKWIIATLSAIVGAAWKFFRRHKKKINVLASRG